MPPLEVNPKDFVEEEEINPEEEEEANPIDKESDDESNSLIPVAFQTLCNEDPTLGSQIVGLFERRMPSLCHDFSVVGCIFSVDTEAFEHVKEHCMEHIDTLKRIARKLFCHGGIKDNVLEQHVTDCVEQFCIFWSQQGFFQKKGIWNFRHRHLGQSHLWCCAGTREKHWQLGHVACRVTSKTLGIGSCKQQWDGVKSLLQGKLIGTSRAKIEKRAS